MKALLTRFKLWSLDCKIISLAQQAQVDATVGESLIGRALDLQDQAKYLEHKRNSLALQNGILQ